MTEALKPLNWSGFGDDTIRETDIWLYDAWSEAIELLAKRDTTTRGFMGKLLPSPIVSINEEDADAIDASILKAFQSGDLIAFALHPQTNEKHFVEADRWFMSCAELVRHYRAVPEHLYDEFGPFLNRRLRVDAVHFLLWLHGKCLTREIDFNPRTIASFKHVPPITAFTQPLEVPLTAERPSMQSIKVSKTVPAGNVSIGAVFNRALVHLYPEHADQSDWPQIRSKSGYGWNNCPPENILEAWKDRLRYRSKHGDLTERTWWESIQWDAAYRLYLAQLESRVKVYYYVLNHGQEFEVPSELLDPYSVGPIEGSPWNGGTIVDLFRDTPYPELDGAICFIRASDETTLWDAFLSEMGVEECLDSKAPRRRGPKRGGGFIAKDRQRFHEIEALIRAGKAQTPYGAAVLLGESLEGRGSEENRVKRLSSRYLRENPDWKKRLSE